MGILRNLLLAGSRSAWLRNQASRRSFVRRAVSRFMPGETLDDAVAAARTLSGRRLGTILTHLGENVADAAEAAEVVSHYLGVVERLRAERLDGEVSVKLTHMGLDLGADLAASNLARLADAADAAGLRLWVDMEDSSYVDRTLGVFREVQARHPKLGLCLQAYLRRTGDALEALIPLGCAIRLVKGAYNEPAEIAYPAKSDVDERFFRLACRLLRPDAMDRGAWLVAGTHDVALIERINAHAEQAGLERDAFEYALLYGIRTDVQTGLASEGRRVRTLISYGAYWFPWYMRRLAERPANVGFVLRSMFAR